MTEHERQADELERELDDMQERADKLEDEIDDVREDWDRKKRDSHVPGAPAEGADEQDD
jgi:predicted  nucleic acid-binding Zn-ribbon protein